MATLDSRELTPPEAHPPATLPVMWTSNPGLAAYAITRGAYLKAYDIGSNHKHHICLLLDPGLTEAALIRDWQSEPFGNIRDFHSALTLVHNRFKRLRSRKIG